MGNLAQVLLVDRRRLLAGLPGVVLGGAGLLAGCCQRAVPVDPRAHQAFFLWAGVTAPDWLGQAHTVYLMAGEVRRTGGFVPLRAVPRRLGPEIWFVVRVERLDWDPALFAELMTRIDRWRMAGNRVAGLQVDFDSATRGLSGYAGFLSRLRRQLPPIYRLSITGLLDWSAGGEPGALAALAGVVDEIVVQTYQGTRTIPGYGSYLASLRRLQMPYRIGLVEGGAWQAPQGLGSDPRFRGYVVFLLRR